MISKQGSDLAQHDGCVLIKGGQRQGYNDEQNSVYVENACQFSILPHSAGPVTY